MKKPTEREAAALASVKAADVEEQNRALAWSIANVADKKRAVTAAGMHPEMALFPLDRFTAQQRKDVCDMIGAQIARLQLMQLAMGIGLENVKHRTQEQMKKRLAELEEWAREAHPARFPVTMH